MHQIAEKFELFVLKIQMSLWSRAKLLKFVFQTSTSETSHDHSNYDGNDVSEEPSSDVTKSTPALIALVETKLDICGKRCSRSIKKYLKRPMKKMRL